jgi:plasmid maintenance system antidote protein VapI
MKIITVIEVKRNEAGVLVETERAATSEEIAKIEEVIETEKQKRNQVTDNQNDTN